MALSNTIKQVTVAGTVYEILPESVSANGSYTASCPTLTANTTLEVASNKTTSLSSSSTSTQYPSAKAVYTLIQSVMKI